MGVIYTAFKKVAYKVLDIITLGNGVPTRINGIKLKLPAQHFRIFPADYEQASFEFFKKHIKQGDTILDIGAHIGLYAIFFAKLSKGKVYSFEPTPSTSQMLRRTIDMNNCNDIVTVVPAAVSGTAGKARFFISQTTDLSVANSLIDYDENAFDIRDGSYEVDMVSIDGFVKAHGIIPNIIKIDAEGVEVELLKGAAYTFLNYRPFATLGLHTFAYKNKYETLEEIWELLQQFKMKVQIDGVSITKEFFCNKVDKVFDVELIPE